MPGSDTGRGFFVSPSVLPRIHDILYVAFHSRGLVGWFIGPSKFEGQRQRHHPASRNDDWQDGARLYRGGLTSSSDCEASRGRTRATDIKYWTLDYVLWAKLELVTIYVDEGNLTEALELRMGTGRGRSRGRTRATWVHQSGP